MHNARSCLARMLFLLPVVGVVSVVNAQTTCTSIPPINPDGDFFSNFGNDCYMVALGAGGAADGFGGDTNAQYDVIYYRLHPRFELILFGTFPQVRYFGLSLYDAHEANIGSIADPNIVPLEGQVNPFQLGVAYVPEQKWAATVSFGGLEPSPEAVTPGCSLGGFNPHGNWLDATQLHGGLSWNDDPAADSLPRHIGGPNTAGAILVRRYVPLGSQQRPAVFVRDLTTGCAVSANDAINTYKVVTTDRTTYVGRWRAKEQWQAHYTYSGQILPKLCSGIDPTQPPLWLRGPEWLPGANLDTAYLAAQVPRSFFNPPPADRYIRIRMRLPSFPAIPCEGDCSRTGDEEMRYSSLSFQNGANTIVSVADKDMVRDENGYITLIAGIGAVKPDWVTPENGYSWVDLTVHPGYLNLTAVNLRSIQPNPSFACPAQLVPPRRQEWTEFGGLMGDYGPLMDFPKATQIPEKAAPYIGPGGSCGLSSAVAASDCRTVYPSPPAKNQ